MLTAPSSTETPARASAAVRPPAYSPSEIRRAVADTRSLLRFRGGTVRRPGVIRVVWVVMAVITLSVVVVPAYSPGAADPDGMAFNLMLLLPTFMVGFLGLSIAAAIASGGGRELLASEHAVVFPVSPTTDHLGALLMAPLNIAWLLQAWFLLGATSYARGPEGLVWLQLIMVLWLVLATTVAQVVAWWVESVRRRRHGVATVRTAGVAVALLFAWLQLDGRLSGVLDAVPTLQLLVAGLAGPGWRFAAGVGAQIAIIVVALFLAGWGAHVAARRQPKDEVKVETKNFEARPDTRTLVGLLVRMDRASVWRAVPMRRGLLVLAVGPGLVAFAGGLQWDTVLVLPALVASGGILLFGVNAWSLDGRGGLWRESLPVDPMQSFVARSWVLAEWLLVASVLTLVLASLRAGMPTAAETTAVLCTLVVVTLQVVAVAMTWSSRRPFSVDLRSARATPAPPTVMVGYSAKLATSTTLTAMVFSTTASLGPAWLVACFAVPFVVWSSVRWWRASRTWVDPVQRAAVVTTVAA